MYGQREFLSVVALATAVATPAVAQTLSAAGTTTTETQSAGSVPNFSRVWTHPGFPWFEPPASGPGPVTNKSRWPQRPIGASGTLALPPLPPGVEGVSDYDQLVGDYSNPIFAAMGSGGGEKVRRYVTCRHYVPEPFKSMLALADAVHLQAGHDTDDAATGQDHDLVRWI
jgi:hypothetical protein